MKYLLILGALFFTTLVANAQQITAKQIIAKSQEIVRGDSHEAVITMTIERPKYTREVKMKSWSLRDELALIIIMAPAREKGTAFLKRYAEIYNWVPSIERVVKLPPSMMMQSWMGSDFTNDDLIRAASILEDYNHTLVGEEEVEGVLCYKIELLPKPDAPVVWGKIVNWISKNDFLERRAEFYDEDEFLINEMIFSDIKKMGGRTVATKIVVNPVEDEGNTTTIIYEDVKFNQPIEESFFSERNMKTIRP